MGGGAVPGQTRGAGGRRRGRLGLMFSDSLGELLTSLLPPPITTLPASATAARAPVVLQGAQEVRVPAVGRAVVEVDMGAGLLSTYVA